MKVAGSVRVPGDKSITHRVLLLAGLTRGTSYIGGALTSLDAQSTARVLRQLGSEACRHAILRKFRHHHAPAAWLALRSPLFSHPQR
jgi:5-enolpyruvylshikimate-3-phosphate synthase